MIFFPFWLLSCKDDPNGVLTLFVLIAFAISLGLLAGENK